MSSSACCVWDFTLPVDDIKVDELKALLREHCKHWCFQEEEGSRTGFQHYQGRINLKLKSRRPSAVFDREDLHFHFSVTSSVNRDNQFYVCKDETRVAGPWSDKDDVAVRYIPRQVRQITELRPWQQSVIDSAAVWDTRTINLIYDKGGNNGKSTLKTYIGVHDIGRSIPFINDYRDIMRMVMCTPKKPLYIIDIPRALKKDVLGQFMSGIETLKDGYAYDDRYKFQEEYFDCPNIWVFMNTIPDTTAWSADRWKIWEIRSETQTLEPYVEQEQEQA